eukprot:798971_1
MLYSKQYDMIYLKIFKCVATNSQMNEYTVNKRINLDKTKSSSKVKNSSGNLQTETQTIPGTPSPCDDSNQVSNQYNQESVVTQPTRLSTTQGLSTTIEITDSNR